MKRLLIATLAITAFAQVTGTPVSFNQGTLVGTAANKGNNVSVTLNWTPVAYPAMLAISDGTNTIQVTRASATGSWTLGQPLP